MQVRYITFSELMNEVHTNSKVLDVTLELQVCDMNK